MRTRNNGFTLVELMVVLALAAIISSITFGAFRSITDGNKRTSCQSNLAQIYKSVRLYSQDFDGKFPYLNPIVNPRTLPVPDVDNNDYVARTQTSAPDRTPSGGIGLWGLYTFRPNDGQICPNNDVNLPLTNEDAESKIGLTGYVKTSKIFHCPADRFDKVIFYRSLITPGAVCSATTDSVPNSQLSFVDGDNKVRLNPAYLSYQNNDTNNPTGLSNELPPMTYSSFRKSESASTGFPAGKRRQLIAFTLSDHDNDPSTPEVTSTLERPLDQATVITWCRFHRSLNNEGQTKDSGRNFDNVLFSDGTVQSLPMVQPVTEASNKTTNGSTNDCTGWRRVKREVADKVQTASECTP